jgi:hypothetical protein
VFLKVERYGPGAGAVNPCDDGARLIKFRLVDPMGRRALAFTHTGVSELLVYQKIRLTKEEEGQPPAAARFTEPTPELTKKLEFNKKGFRKEDESTPRIVALFL